VSQTAPPPNPLLELVFTLVLPSIALDQLSQPGSLGPFWALVAGLAFPIAFGAWCFWSKRGWNVFSAIGLVTILLSGGLGLLKLDAFWIGMKEGLIGAAIGVSFPLSHYFGRPLLQSLVMQPQLLNVTAVKGALLDAPKRSAFDRVLFHASCAMGLSMIGSAVANFLLALWLLAGKEPGSEAFVKGLAKLNWVSTVVLGVPMMAVMLIVFIWLLRQIQRITGLQRDDLLNPGRTVRRKVGTK
jgi:hypothetical protein